MRRASTSELRCSSSNSSHVHHEPHPHLQIGDESSLEQRLNLLLSDFPTDNPPADSIYLPLLKACSKLKSLPLALRLHHHLTQIQPNISIFLAEHVLLALAKCGGLDNALSFFYSLPCRSVFSWTAIISGFADSGDGHGALQMGQSMLQDGFEPDGYTFTSLFKACGSINDVGTGKKLHSRARDKGFTSDIFVLTSLLSMYAKCGAIAEAADIFCALLKPDVVSWNAMLTAYINSGEGEKALHVYRQMHESGMDPSSLTVVSVLQACKLIAGPGREGTYQTGQEVGLFVGEAFHSLARSKELISHSFVQTALVSMYGNCGHIATAENVFNSRIQRHISSWNAMLSAYVEQGQAEKALQLFVHMHREGVEPDKRTFATTLQACATLVERDEDDFAKARITRAFALEIGDALHVYAQEKKFSSDVYVGTTVLSLYAKCGAISKAEEVFGAMSQLSTVPLNAMLGAYVEAGQAEKVVPLYKQMHLENVPLDLTLLIGLLQACGEVGCVDMCLQLHFVVISAEQDGDLFTPSALIHAYGSCAHIQDAEFIFAGLSHKDAPSWNAHIAGFAGEGDFSVCMQLFEEIQLVGVEPDRVAYASLIFACNHAGLVNRAIEYFVAMTIHHGILPDMKHYNSLTDLLGRAGDFTRLGSFLCSMWKVVDVTMWLSVLGSCRTHGNVELAKQAFRHAVTLAPEQATSYISMYNICADAGDIRDFMEWG